MSLAALSFPQLEQALRDLRSHIPGDASWQAAAGTVLRAHVVSLLDSHPDRPTLSEAEARRANELRELQARHAAERNAEALAAAEPQTDHGPVEEPAADQAKAAEGRVSLGV